MPAFFDNQTINQINPYESLLTSLERRMRLGLLSIVSIVNVYLKDFRTFF